MLNEQACVNLNSVQKNCVGDKPMYGQMYGHSNVSSRYIKGAIINEPFN